MIPLEGYRLLWKGMKLGPWDQHTNPTHLWKSMGHTHFTSPYENAVRINTFLPPCWIHSQGTQEQKKCALKLA